MAACDSLAEVAEQAREEAEEAAKETKDEVLDAWGETRKAVATCGAIIGGSIATGGLAGIGIGLAGGEACIGGLWDAATSWCDAREAAGEASDAAQAATNAQGEYLKCLNDHKRG
ncbi:MAG: hypothetical protein WA962_03470 [Ornithinimicrobium sp.]